MSGAAIPVPVTAINPGQAYSLDRKAKKNAQSRARASKLRERIEILQQKPNEARTPEELQLLQTFEERRRRKNERSRERAIEKKLEIENILTKPDRKRSKNEKSSLEVAMNAKQRKNEGDRLRRERIKLRNMAAGGNSKKSDSKRGKNLVSAANTTDYGAGYGISPPPVSVDVVNVNVNPYAGSYGSYPVPGGTEHHGSSYGAPYNVTVHPPPVSASALPSSSGSAAAATGDANNSHVQQQRHADGSISISIFGSNNNNNNSSSTAAALNNNNNNNNNDGIVNVSEAGASAAQYGASASSSSVVNNVDMSNMGGLWSGDGSRGAEQQQQASVVKQEDGVGEEHNPGNISGV